ncbi:MAG: F0F1 ATP synthase subunit B [Isosphaerales bacterium]
MLRQSSLVSRLGFLAVLIIFTGGERRVFAQSDHKTAPPGVQAEATPAASEGEHSSSEKPDPLKREPGLAIWTFVVFVGLFAVLARYAWKPLINALQDREKHLEHVLTETERARNESEANLAEHRKLIARAGDEVRGILDKARQDGQTAFDERVKQAQGEAELARQRAQRDIASARDQALAEIWQKTAEMAVSVAGRVLAKELSDTEHRRLLDVAIQELPAAPGSNGHGAKVR